MMRHELTAIVGGMFEEYFPTAFDENDFCYQVANAGLAIHYWPKIRIIHHEGSFRAGDRDSGFTDNLKKWKAIWGDREEGV